MTANPLSLTEAIAQAGDSVPGNAPVSVRIEPDNTPNGAPAGNELPIAVCLGGDDDPGIYAWDGADWIMVGALPS